MMKNTTAILVAIIALIATQSAHAYKYRVANLSNKPIYIDLRGAAKGTLFTGDKGAKDSWKIKDYDMIPAKGTKDYSFGGVFGEGTAAFCINAIRVGNSVQNLAPAQIQKAPEDRAAFEDAVSKIAIIGNYAETLASKAPGALGTVLTTIAGSLNSVIKPIAGLGEDWLCFDMTFFVGPNPHKNTNLYDYVVIAQQGIQPTGKFTGIQANLDDPKTLPNTPFWTRVKDDILPAAKAKASQAMDVGGAEFSAGVSEIKGRATGAATSIKNRALNR